MELPYNAEAEKQVLANMIFSSDMLVETFSRLSAEDFYLKEHQIIFKTLKTIFDTLINQNILKSKCCHPSIGELKMQKNLQSWLFLLHTSHRCL